MSGPLPCPFCGKQPRACPDTSYGYALVFCPDENECLVQPTTDATFSEDETLEDAIRKWNTRSTPAPSEVVEAVARVIDPGAWALQDKFRELRRRDIEHATDAFKDKESMNKAREVISALQPIPGRERGFPRIPTPEMIAAAWDVVDKAKRGAGITKLMPGLGVREIWEAMHDAAPTRALGARPPASDDVERVATVLAPHLRLPVGPNPDCNDQERNRETALRVARAALTAMPSERDGCEMPEVAAMRYIEQLRSVEGATVTILCDNPEAETLDTQVAIDVCAEWTNYLDCRFYGESVLQCLAKAVGAREAAIERGEHLQSLDGDV